ncbi:hypothetical protein EV191_101493 [Tamaricihabitans halophyticus]|uniref:Histidine kinase/DNA gyrase B/HSP90-like ATPase n=1 Tax=Tamaricihabitans halophyticus TaxID=1262583 RepID=A0A4R2R1I3_9PSEU|nr:hypothetical protein [Tamaricihabitans halophyticus]TCP56550.1 hypothetical protein EV191_101493 [Tamaricihabitans halophyticus]
MSTDPFGTERLRAAVLRSWLDSPTRFTEDANAEEDLRLGGYRDRLFVELAQNAADAAALAGTRGSLRVSVVDGELRVANTGAELDAAGVAALASLRASAKRGKTVGKFGVGFAAVLSITGEPRLVSRSGGVAFSAQASRDMLADYPELAERMRERSGNVPVLRMVWPCGDAEPPVPEGFSTEVRLRPRDGVDVDALLADFAGQVPDLLLSLPWLENVRIVDDSWHSEQQAGGLVELRGPDGARRWLCHRASGSFSATELAGQGVEAQDSPEWSVCLAVPVDADGKPEPLTEDVLHTPTPTDERLSLPVRVLATVPVEPSRRRVLPSAAGDAVLTAVADRYPDLLGLLRAEHRPLLVPTPDFPRSEVDEKLRELVLARLRESPWLPGAAGESLAPARARVLDVPGAEPELTELVADVLAGLLPAEYAAADLASRLTSLGVARVRLAELVEALTGVRRSPSWWRQLYTALAPLAETDPNAREELAGLPVPLVGDTLRFGPRGALLPDFAAAAELLADARLPGLALVHADAVHPLLERLGAVRAGPAELLAAPELRAAVEADIDAEPVLPEESSLADIVLSLVRLAGVEQGEHPWLGALALPDSAGDLRRADELALPGAPILAVLAADSPLGVLAEDYTARWPAEVLTGVGVLRGFTVLAEDAPTAPDHGLADEQAWWDELAAPPDRLTAVRDLDLVDETCWPEAIRLLAAEPETLRALREPDGYTGWWLARYAQLAGQPPSYWRLPAATELAGLFDPLPDTGLPDWLATAVGVRERLRVTDAAAAATLLSRLADPERVIDTPVVFAAHTELTRALRAELIEVSEVDPPERVRVLGGGVLDAANAVLVDGPWLFGALPEERSVIAPDGQYEALAELLDVPFGTEELEFTPDGGEALDWGELSAVRLACGLLGIARPERGVWLHDELSVDGVRVPWWVSPDGEVHAEDTPEGLGRALAWQTGEWSRRHLLIALLTDPEPATLLG